MPDDRDRGRRIRNDVGLVLYLAGGWRTYKEINEEFGWTAWTNHCTGYDEYRTTRRNVKALEEAGLPVEWERDGYTLKMRLPPDWVARTVWLRRYIIRKQPLNGVGVRKESNEVQGL